MRSILLVLVLVALVFDTDLSRSDDRKPQAAEDRPKVVKEQVRGGIVFPAERRMWTRITGKVKVVNAYTLRFEDGTEVCLGGGIDAPELDQKGLIGESFYPCGKQAAEFLQKLIGDQAVTFLTTEGHVRVGNNPAGSCFVGETNLEIEMVRNGWALSHHSGMDAWEIIARENKRGLWRGKFIVPERWRLGERLPEEPLLPGYRVNDPLQLLFREYRVSGPQVEKPGEGCYLVCTYSTRPVVMVYTWELNAPVIQLIKKLDEVTRKEKDRRLGSYVVLFCESRDQEKQLQALAARENLQHTLLALVVINQVTLRDNPGLRQFLARFGRAAQTRIILATPRREVKASHAYRAGELKGGEMERVLADLPRILPKDDTPRPPPAVDLTTIDRRLTREPAYQSGKPRYCLLVFGPQAKTRVWLVLDGKVLYVDRSGTGDLTGPGKRLEDPRSVKVARFRLGPITSEDGKTIYPNVVVSVPLSAEVKKPAEVVVYTPPELRKAGVHKMGIESERGLAFADSPKNAPILHFDGPLTFELENPRQVFVRGEKPNGFSVMIGTRGLGQGTFAALSLNSNAPAGDAEITFPNRHPSGKPIVVQVPLKPPD
jgi:endonuclease YncB( thermonuclease family)